MYHIHICFHFPEQICHNTLCFEPSNHFLKSLQRTVIYEWLFVAAQKGFPYTQSAIFLQACKQAHTHTQTALRVLFQCLRWELWSRRCGMWRQTEPDSESSSKVTQEELRRMCALLCEYKSGHLMLCACVCSFTCAHPRPQRSHDAGRVHPTRKAILRAQPLLTICAWGLNASNQLFKQSREQLEKNHAADISRPTLPGYLLPHLAFSTAIASYRRRAVVSYSMKQGGEVDKQVAGESLHSQTVLKNGGWTTV